MGGKELKIIKEIEIEYLCHFHAIMDNVLPDDCLIESTKEEHECDYPESLLHDGDKCHVSAQYRISANDLKLEEEK